MAVMSSRVTLEDFGVQRSLQCVHPRKERNTPRPYGESGEDKATPKEDA